jgi:hypothetical protein
MNLRLNSMAMFDFFKLLTTPLVTFGYVYYSAEILGYGCKMIPILDIHQYLEIEDDSERFSC